MSVFKKLYSMGHEEVVFFSDKTCGLKAIVAIHDTALGPALGGCRMWPYTSEEEALEDVLRLSRGMTYKASISGLNLGGGKTVIIGDPKKDKSEALFRSFGRFIESLNGRYIPAEDVNVNVRDIEHVFRETSHVVGVSKVHGGSGNPAPYTALGVFRGIEASCNKAFGNRSVAGKVVAIQGIGAVGTYLAKYLVEIMPRFSIQISTKTILKSLSPECLMPNLSILAVSTLSIAIFSLLVPWVPLSMMIRLTNSNARLWPVRPIIN